MVLIIKSITPISPFFVFGCFLLIFLLQFHLLCEFRLKTQMQAITDFGNQSGHGQAWPTWLPSWQRRDHHRHHQWWFITITVSIMVIFMNRYGQFAFQVCLFFALSCSLLLSLMKGNKSKYLNLLTNTSSGDGQRGSIFLSQKVGVSILPHQSFQLNRAYF